MKQAAHKHRRKGPARPKRPLSYQLRTSRSTDHSTDQGARRAIEIASNSLSATSTSTLDRDVLLLDLIIRRNKNQHRNQQFFKDLCLLRSSLRRILAVQQQLTELSQQAQGVSTAELVRQRFEKEASLRSQKDVLEEHVREVLVPKCYITFSGLVSDSQFANLGVALVGVLSTIAAGADGVGLVKKKEIGGRAKRSDANAAAPSRKALNPETWRGSLTGTSTRVTGEDQGEVIGRVYDSGDGGIGDTSGYGNARFSGFDGNEGNDGVQEQRSGVGGGHGEDETGKRPDQPQKQSPLLRSSSQAESLMTQADNMRGKEELKTKKKKKRKDTIDDLFSGLL